MAGDWVKIGKIQREKNKIFGHGATSGKNETPHLWFTCIFIKTIKATCGQNKKIK